jgi:LytS/YehU family sensor histidine kinase
MHRGDLMAIVYLENSLCAEAFTEEQRSLVAMLGHHAAIAMATADYHKAQIEVMQSKINPHFLHNALSVIAELIVSKPSMAEDAVLRLSKLYRYVLNSSADQTVTLEEEIAIVRDYLTIERHRYGERLRTSFAVTGPVSQVSVPALMLQPLVENAVRHGVAKKVGAGTVDVTILVADDRCKMRVADDGPGWVDGPPRGGFGLRSVRERLTLLYGRDFELNIERGDGVTVEVLIPVRRRS